MAAQTIFARVTPKSIKITEKYEFDAEVTQIQASRLTKKETANPSGELELLVPYDGFAHFTKVSKEDVERQLPQGLVKIWQQILGIEPTTRARIGQLGFDNHGKTNLASALKLGLNDDTFELAIPFGSDEWSSLNDLLAGRHIVRIAWPFQPNATGSPLKVELTVHDERPFDELNDDLWQQLPPAHQPLHKVPEAAFTTLVAALARQESFEPNLVVDLQFTLTLDRKRAKGLAPLKLEMVGLKWSTPLPNRRISLNGCSSDPARAHPALYDPVEKMILWRDIPFERIKPKPEDKTVQFRTPLLHFALTQPGPLYNEAQLGGRATVKTALLLSGAQATFYDATGAQSTLKPEHQSEITLNFTVDLAESMRKKVCAPYQHHQYEGVVLNHWRMHDTENILEDLGFEVRSLPLSAPGDNHQRYLVVGRRSHGNQSFWLALLLEGRTMQMSRSNSVSKVTQNFTTLTETGIISVYMRGKLNGDYAVQLTTMNAVQQRFERLFSHLALFG